MSPEIRYAIDGDDCIVGMNAAWGSFATENHGSTLLAPLVLGRKLWEFIDGETTVQIYRRLFERVRGGTGPARFAFRCDAPDARRFLEMNIEAGDDRCLRFNVRTVSVEPRAPLALLDPGAPRSDVHVRLCAWCKRIADDLGRWVEIEEAIPSMALLDQTPLPTLTHGICDDCERAFGG